MKDYMFTFTTDEPEYETITAECLQVAEKELRGKYLLAEITILSVEESE